MYTYVYKGERERKEESGINTWNLFKYMFVREREGERGRKRVRRRSRGKRREIVREGEGEREKEWRVKHSKNYNIYYLQTLGIK